MKNLYKWALAALFLFAACATPPRVPNKPSGCKRPRR